MAQFVRGSVRLFFKGDPTLVGNWSFDEESGTIAKDLSGKGNNGTLTNGPLWVSGKFGGALFFDGLNDYVLVPHSSSISITGNNLTIMMWAKTTATRPGSISKRQEIGDGNYQFSLLETGTAGIQLCVRYSSGWVCFYSLNATYDGNWRLYAAIKTNTEINFYQDGKLIRSVSTSGSLIDPNNANLYIGSVGGSADFFNGFIDELAIFSRALSPREIQSYYNWAIGKSTPIIYTPRKNAAVLNVGEGIGNEERGLVSIVSNIEGRERAIRSEKERLVLVNSLVNGSGRTINNERERLVSIQSSVLVNRERRERPSNLIKDLETEKINFDIKNL